MAQIQRPGLSTNLRGRVGDLVYKWYGKRLVITRAPRPSTKKHSARKARSCSEFAAASRYAEQARNQPALWKVYAAHAKPRRIPVRSLAISDFRTVPTFGPASIHCQTSGVAVSFSMADRFKAKTVRVDVIACTDDGCEFARGAASSQRPGEWRYVLPEPPTRHFRVEVAATDRFERTTTVRYRGDFVGNGTATLRRVG